MIEIRDVAKVYQTRSGSTFAVARNTIASVSARPLRSCANSRKPHTATYSDSMTVTMTKMMWKARSDMVSSVLKPPERWSWKRVVLR